MLAYFGNIFGMLGVALIATAFFKDDWQAEIITRAIFILWVLGHTDFHCQ